MDEQNSVHDPIATLYKEIQSWDVPFVKLDCFGTDDANRIFEIMGLHKAKLIFLPGGFLNARSYIRGARSVPYCQCYMWQDISSGRSWRNHF
jgi:hypothetical protein